MARGLPESTPRILIVGAGPTGLTAAVELARQGILADVIEKSATPSNLSRAVGVLPRSIAIFERAGVADQILQQAIAVERVIFHNQANSAVDLRLDDLPEKNHRLFALAQDQTEAVLRNRFHQLGGTVQFGCKLTQITQTEAAVNASINNAPHSYDYVIGCDGTRSAVRSGLGIAFNGIDLPEEWSIADVDATDWPNPNCFQGFLLEQGKVAIVVPLAANRFRVIANQADALAALPVPMIVTTLHREATFTISVRQVTHYQQGRVFLAGDAAHCHSPVGGRGMNLGIADAADLAGRFVAGGLEGYHAARQAEGKAVLTLSERGRRIATSQNLLLRRGLLAGLNLAGRFPPIHRAIVRGILGL
nr:NAD(P)/FAD-dependent oxidoreductase [Amylibacter sp.]